MRERGSERDRQREVRAGGWGGGGERGGGGTQREVGRVQEVTLAERERGRERDRQREAVGGGGGGGSRDTDTEAGGV